MWNRAWGGFPSDEFFSGVDPLLSGIGERLPGRYFTSDIVAGVLTAEWAKKLGLQAGIPIPVGAFDAHWDAIGAGCRIGDVVNVVCGVVPGSIHPNLAGVEAGLSATGDIFDAIARRAGTSVVALSEGLEKFRAGATGLLRLTWDNGDRTVLVNPDLGGVTLGWKLTHTAQDELFAAIEGTAFHTRIIIERMEEHGVPIRRVINGGGIPQRNETLNQVYANVLNKPVLVPKSDVTSLGSAIFAFLAARTFKNVEEAQDALCPEYRTVAPDAAAARVYEELYGLYRKLYFGLGRPGSDAVNVGDVLPALRRIAREAEAARQEAASQEATPCSNV
jgi:L-ribulokinase